jgi:hypothetical protein
MTLRIVNDALPVLSLTVAGKDWGLPIQFQQAQVVPGIPLPPSGANVLLVVRALGGLTPPLLWVVTS